MNFLGIETSCDETAASVVTDQTKVLSNVVLSQDELHSPYGGIVPELASRNHVISINYIIEESLKRAQLKIKDIDLISVTQGPGLIGSLLVGLSFAKGLAYTLQKPLIPIDHLEAHIHSVFIENKDIPFPALALLVSGGHTSLYLMRKKLDTRVLARTRDDAAGEALDKIAKFMEIGYPGGPVIEKLSQHGDPKEFDFALPKMSDQSLDFSFSGFKTAALRHIKTNKLNKKNPQLKDFLASFEHSVVNALISNIKKAASQHFPESLILCGGVARNKRLRKRFKELAKEQGMHSFIPSPEFCTDNAAMVASLAWEKYNQGEKGKLSLDLNAYAQSSY
ncbi:MAG: tRNA (adenosine(37)-N6)-threonylcarbamoyltransferase complex transferase subunit TsaD [Candidatus Aminicenantes bacterium]|nr:tRNA (adenosine(37)-N6)-threonylcarbamoyltransferase complex transferase subunit TsaD [Candidatus Aminicenantes bacterium]